MATVKITETVRNDISGVIVSQFQARRRLIEQRAILNSSDSEFFTQSIINLWLEDNGSSRAKFEAVPPAAFITTRRCRIRRINTVDLQGFVDVNDFARQIHVPNDFAEWSGVSLTLDVSSNRFVQDVLANTQQVQTERQQLAAEQTQMQDAVKKVLEAFPTLNRAIEFWSPLESLLTNSLKDKLAKKIERNKSTQDLSQLEDISLDNLNVSLVRNKLATA
jgi:hypothetical protein